MVDETKSRVAQLRESLRFSAEAVEQIGRKLVALKKQGAGQWKIEEVTRAYELAREQHKSFKEQEADNG